ncbi:hypothetical protein PJW08_09140 [Tenacibaculum finnmarkense]|nr:hypothetical protein PJW08_09140 [Tenacibaculum finnmarkense]
MSTKNNSYIDNLLKNPSVAEIATKIEKVLINISHNELKDILEVVKWDFGNRKITV